MFVEVLEHLYFGGFFSATWRDAAESYSAVLLYQVAAICSALSCFSTCSASRRSITSRKLQTSSTWAPVRGPRCRPRSAPPSAALVPTRRAPVHTVPTVGASPGVSSGASRSPRRTGCRYGPRNRSLPGGISGQATCEECARWDSNPEPADQESAPERPPRRLQRADLRFCRLVRPSGPSRCTLHHSVTRRDTRQTRWGGDGALASGWTRTAWR